jgi:hypothetical protein
MTVIRGGIESKGSRICMMRGFVANRLTTATSLIVYINTFLAIIKKADSNRIVVQPSLFNSLLEAYE